MFFFVIKKKYFLSELRKKLGHNFDVENCKLSIGEVFRAIPALCREVGYFKVVSDWFFMKRIANSILEVGGGDKKMHKFTKFVS